MCSKRLIGDLLSQFMLPRKAMLKLNREMSWLLTLFAAIMILTGYGSTRRIISPYVANSTHLVIGWFFVGLFILHTIVAFIYVPFNWDNVVQRIKELNDQDCGLEYFKESLDGVFLF